MPRRAFTLIELLVAIGIIVTLVGMLMPIYGISKRQADRINTLSLLRKVETALRLFKTDVRVYPWDCFLQPGDASSNPAFNVSYPDVRPSTPAWANRLYYHLGTSYDETTASRIRQDADTARNAFNYDLRKLNSDGSVALSNNSTAVSPELQENPNPATLAAGITTPGYSIMAFRLSDALPYSFQSNATPNIESDLGLPAYLNRLAQERYALAMYAGAVHEKGPTLQDVVGPTGTVYSSANPNAAARAATAVVATPASADSPGWSDNYLAGEIQPSQIRGQQLVDLWGRPLVYLAQVLPGCKPGLASLYGTSYLVRYLDQNIYGLGAHGRRSLAPFDAYRKQALAADATTDPDTGQERLPDPSQPFVSDVRYYAPAAQVMEFEVWSAGSDGRVAWRRDEAVNRDNLAPRDYQAGLR